MGNAGGHIESAYSNAGGQFRGGDVVSVEVSVRKPTPRRDGAVLVAGEEMSAYEARELSRRILSAAIAVERGERSVRARASSTQGV